MSRTKSVTVHPIKLRLVKKTTETFLPLRVVAEWAADDAAFIQSNDTAEHIASAFHPRDEQLGAIPGLSIHLGKGSELYLPPDAVAHIIDAIRDGQKAQFIGRMASVLVKS